MGGVCGKHGGEKKYIQRLWLENPKKRDHFNDLGVERHGMDPSGSG
jgi:hypothetical protein